MEQSYTVTLKIEGIRVKGASAAARTEACFYFGEEDNLPLANGSNTNAYQNYLNAIPSTISADIDLFTSAYNISAPSIELVKCADIGKLFFNMNRSASEGYASGAIGSVDTSISVSYGGTIEVGDSLYVADECMYVSAVSSYSGGVYALTVVRAQGWEGSAGIYVDGASIYVNYVPYFHLRRVILEVLDNADSGASVFTYQGLIDKIDTSSDGTNVIIGTRDYISSLIDIQIPTTRDLFKATFNTATFATNDNFVFAGSIDPLRNNDFENYQFAVAYREYDDISPDPEGSTYKSWRLGDAVYMTSGSYDSDLDSYSTSDQRFWNFTDGQIPVFPKTINSGDLDDIISNDSIVVETISFNSDTPDKMMPWNVSYSGFDISRNPVFIALVFLLSTGNNTNYSTFSYNPDVLSRSWAAGIDADLLDIASWHELLSAVQHVRVDCLNIGFDGQDNLKDIIIKLLRMADAFMFVDGTGKISVSKYESFSYQELEDDLALNAAQQSLVYLEAPNCKMSREGNNKNIVARLGGLPGIEAITVSIKTLTGDRRDSNLNSEEITLDYSSFDRSKAERGTRVFSDVENKIRNYKNELFEPSPYLECTVPIKYEGSTGLPGIAAEAGLVPDLASWVIVRGTNEVTGPDGTTIVINEQENWVIFLGRIVGYTINLANMTYDLKIYLQNWKTGIIPKLVAPSVRIESYDNGTKTITCDSGLSDRGIYDGFYGNSGFKDGDQVRIVDEYGRDSFLLFQSTWYTTIDGDVDDTTTPGKYLITVLNGLYSNIPSDMNYYLRIADYSEYDNPTATAYLDYLPEDQRRLWSFLSNDGSKLNGIDDGDVWSF